MKLLSSEQFNSADRLMMSEEDCSVFDLITMAGAACFDKLPIVEGKSKVAVVCGLGNNGGDGLYIASRCKGFAENLKVYVLDYSPNRSEGFKAIVGLMNDIGLEFQLIKSADELDFSETDLIIDAILGTGTNRELEGLLADCVNKINETGIRVISIDIPSGMPMDGVVTGTAIKATTTLTIGAPKLAFYLEDNKKWFGEMQIIPFYKEEILGKFNSSLELVDQNFAKAILKEREDISHKGTFGKALICCGSEGKYGAAILSARACMRSGVGLLTVHVPSNAVDLIHQALPEALLDSDKNATCISSIEDIEKYDAVGIGPGIGKSNETVEALIALLKADTKPLVLDADALNILSEHPDLFSYIPKGSILTPHPKEFERLFGSSKDSKERMEKQVKLSKHHQVIIVCKGHNAVITGTDENVYINSSGNSGLAKGGSGDVLTGIITSLLAQKYEPLHAAILGVYVHGFSADLLLEEMHPAGILPSDVIENLPKSFRKIAAV